MLVLFALVDSKISAFKMAKLWLIRARRRFSINGLFVRFVVELVLVSNVFPAGDVAVDDDGDDGVTEFAVFVLFVVEFEF